MMDEGQETVLVQKIAFQFLKVIKHPNHIMTLTM
jgi:hypothetical protein